MPLFGVNVRVKKILDRQMRKRTKDILFLWPDNEKITLVYNYIVNLLISFAFWKAPLFHPDDPCDIVFWKPNDDLDLVDVLFSLEDYYSLPSCVLNDICDDFDKLTLIQFVNIIVDFYYESIPTST